MPKEEPVKSSPQNNGDVFLNQEEKNKTQNQLNDNVPLSQVISFESASNNPLNNTGAPAVNNLNNQSQVPEPSIYGQTNKTPKKFVFSKKIKIALMAVFLVLVLAGAGFLAWRWYERSSDERILTAASLNLLNARDLHSKATVGVEGIALNFNLFVDKDQDVKLTAKFNLLGEMEVEGLWFPEQDKAYAGNKSSYSFNYDDDEDKENKMEYVEFTNVKKTIEKYENEFTLTDVLNPTKDFFSGENMKYVKRESIDTIGGEKLYKYSFKPTQEFIEEKIDKATKDKDLPFELEKSEVVITFWIQDRDLKINKLEGSIKISIEASESEKKKMEEEKQDCLKNEMDYYQGDKEKAEKYCSSYRQDDYKQEFKIDWKQEFSYDFKEDITQPNPEDVTESIDIYKELDQNYQNDQTKIDDMQDIQKALKEYHRDKGYYPRDLKQLTEEKKPSRYSYSSYQSPYLYSLPKSPDENDYKYEPRGTNIQEYKLSVKLAAPEYYENSEFIKDGTLILTEKSSNSFLLEEKDEDKNSTGPSAKARDAKDARKKSDLNQVKAAIDQFRINSGSCSNQMAPHYLSDANNNVFTAVDKNGKYPNNYLSGDEYPKDPDGNEYQIDFSYTSCLLQLSSGSIIVSN